jgi:Transglycosylase SLT domain
LHYRRSVSGIVLLVCLAALCLAPRTVGVSADDLTPTLVGSTLEATATSVTVEPTQNAYPTVAREQSTPVSYFAPVATEPPLSAPTSLSPASPTATAISSPPATVSPTPTPILAPYVPPPSPEQLKLNARLRWGTHVPTAVRRWAFLIVPAARKYHLDPNILAAVMTMESAGDPSAQSYADARGLMQILHGPWDAAENVDLGARLLSRLFGEFGSWRLALAAYNAGANAVREYGGVPPYRETRDYVIVVSYLYDLYSHHPLSAIKKAQYRKTLIDLRHFARERKQVAILVRAGHISDGVPSLCLDRSENCGTGVAAPLFPTLDPFWPLAGPPDPLQQVDPLSPAGPTIRERNRK